MNTYNEEFAMRESAKALKDSLETQALGWSDVAQVNSGDMRQVAYFEVRGAWEAHFKNDKFPDFRIVVSHIGATIYTDVYARMTRFSRVTQDPLFSLDHTN